MMNGEYILRRTIFGLTILALVLTIGLSACDYLDPSPDATVVEPPSTGNECDDVASLQVGSAIYRCLCAACHGLDGAPLIDDVTDIRGFSDEEKFHAALNNGPGIMPPYPGFDSNQRAALFAYVRDTLGK